MVMARPRGAVLAGVAAVVVVLILIGIGLYFLLRKKTPPVLPPVNPLPPPTSLSTGQTLQVGQKLFDATGRYYLVVQSDGNLVIYDSQKVPLIPGVWSCCATGWNPPVPSNQAFFLENQQSDGNIVLYNADKSRFGWNSGTYDKTNPTDPNSPYIVNQPNTLILNGPELQLYNKNGLRLWP